MQLSPIKTEQRQKIDIKAGDTIRVWQRIQEGKKSRLQAFEGIIISRKHGSEPGATFTVRKISKGIGVELTLPLYSPVIEKIELVSRPKKVRRSKLYYLRERAARQVRKKMKQMKQIGKVVIDAAANTEAEAAKAEGEKPKETEKTEVETTTKEKEEKTEETKETKEKESQEPKQKEETKEENTK